MKGKINNEKGVSLIEILAAIVLLSIVFISFYTFFIQSATYTQMNKKRLNAVDAVEKAVSDLRDGTIPFETAKCNEQKLNKSYPVYPASPEHTVFVNGELMDSGTKDRLCKVKVTVKTIDQTVKTKGFSTEIILNVEAGG